MTKEGGSAAWTIREAGRDDLAELERLESIFPSDRISALSFRRFMASGRAEVWVAAAGGRLLGSALVLYRPWRASAHLASLVSDPAHRGQGIGRGLLAFAEAAALARDRQRMRLEVRVDNEVAIALYLSAGYRRVTVRPGYYQDGQDALAMLKELGKGTQEDAQGPPAHRPSS